LNWSTEEGFFCLHQEMDEKGVELKVFVVAQTSVAL
jgi:hypothetical protein